MKRNTFRMAACALAALSLALAACGPAATRTPTPAPGAPETNPPATAPTSPATPGPASPGGAAQPQADKPVTTQSPQYGGTLTLSLSADITNFETINTLIGGPTKDLTNQELWAGDWTKGNAGGYGTGESSWNARLNNFDQKAGLLAAASPKWTIDEAGNTGAIVYQVRQGVHYALNPNSEASRLVGGREMTTDDVVFNLKRVISAPKSSVYLGKPEIRAANIVKTGPWEITITVPVPGMMTALTYIGGTPSSYIVPPEVVSKYGDMANWKNSVGTGPFILVDYVAGSAAVLTRNTNYWMTDPVGPGKGNQLPYLDTVRYLILPDASTRQAALRTAKIDQLSLGYDDANQMRKMTPGLLESPAGEAVGGWGRIHFNTARKPFDDVRVRRAMVMSIDYDTINATLYGGNGQIITYPLSYQKEYAALSVRLEDPDLPASIKERFSYEPDKAKQLLKEAGYPNGFKTSVLTTSTSVDSLSILKDMWSKVGVDLSFDIKDAGVMTSVVTSRNYDMTNGAGGTPVSTFFSDTTFIPGAPFNASQVDDPYINDLYAKMTKVAPVDLNKAMGYYREIALYALDQSFGFGGPAIQGTIFWWPWLRNYSGETSLGFSDSSWQQYVWYDSALKKTSGR